MKKHILKLRPLLLLMVLFVLANCQEDLYDTQHVQLSNESKSVLLRGREAQERMKMAVESLNGNGGRGMAMLKSRINADTNDDPSFRSVAQIQPYIDGSEVAKLTSFNGSINYTFRVGLPDASANKFYNLVITDNKGHEKQTLITYNLSKDFSASYAAGVINFSKFTGTILFEDIGGGDGDYPCTPGPYTPVPVNSGGGGGGGSGGSGGGSSSGSSGTGTPPPLLIDVPNPRGQEVAIKFNAIQIAPITMPIVGTTLPFYPPASGGTGGTIKLPPMIGFSLNIPGIANNSGHDPCFDPILIGILEPPTDPIKEHEKNCAELKKLMGLTGIKTSFNNLKNWASDPSKFYREYGYKFEDNKSPEELQLGPNSDHTLQMPTGGQIYGGSHTHPDPNDFKDNIPLFSLPDIYKLGQIATNYQPLAGQFKNMNKFVVTLTIDVPDEQGNTTQSFALKIDDWYKFRTFVLDYGASEDFRDLKNMSLEKIYTQIKKNGGGMSNYISALFKFMNNNNIGGVSLYKANSDFTSWSKLEFDPLDNSITPNPCK